MLFRSLLMFYNFSLTARKNNSSIDDTDGGCGVKREVPTGQADVTITHKPNLQ